MFEVIKQHNERYLIEYADSEVIGGRSENQLKSLPCCCPECRAGQAGELAHDWGQGHFLCRLVPDDMLRAEAAGFVSASLTANRWEWYLR